MLIRNRLLSCATIGALAAGTLAFAPTPAQAAGNSATATYQCVGAKNTSLAGVSVPLTLTLQELTDGLTAGTPLQPMLSSTVGQAGSVVQQLLAVVDSVLTQVLGTVFDLLNQVFGTALPTTSFSATVSDLQLQLVDGLGTAVSTVGATLSTSLSLGALSQNNPLSLALAPLTSGLSAADPGVYGLSVPTTFDLSFVGDTVSKLGCTVSSVGGGLASKIDKNRVVLQPGVVVRPGATKPGTKASNPCTAAAAKKGTAATKLTVALKPKKVSTKRQAVLSIVANYKIKGKKRKQRATGRVLVCDGAKALGYTKLSRGKKKVALPTMSAGKHRIVVRYLGGGKAKPVTKRVVLTVKR